MEYPRLLPGEDLCTLFDRFVFVQARRGFRFGVDAVLLARHVLDGPHGRGLEVGTGCGVVSILLAGWGYRGPLTAVEVQPALADRARRNVAANGLGDRISVLDGDVLDPGTLPAGARFDRIFSNPPFYRLGTGRPNPDPERAIARHESRLPLEGLLDLVRDRLSREGLATVVYPATREGEVIARAAERDLSVTRVVPALPRPGAPPEVVILDLARPRGRLCVQGDPVLMR